MMRCMLFTGLAVGFLLAGTISSDAAENPRLKENPAITNGTLPAPLLPDLTITQANWSSTPRDGDTVGTSSILNIGIMNKGRAAAGASRIKIECTALSSNSCPSELNGTPSFSPLGPGESAGLAWPPLSSQKWPSGTFRLDIFVDHGNAVREANERNNGRQLTFSIVPQIHKIISASPGNTQIAEKAPPSVTAAPPAQPTAQAGGMPYGVNMTQKPKPDLVVTGITYTPTQLKGGDPVRFNVTFENRGNANSVRTLAKMVYFLRDEARGVTAGGGALSLTIPALGPGASTTILSQEGRLTNHDNGAPVGGEYTLRATVDTADRNDESNEDNNVLELKQTMKVEYRTDLKVLFNVGWNSKDPHGYQHLQYDQISVGVGIPVRIQFHTKNYTRYAKEVNSIGRVVVKSTGFPDYPVPANKIKTFDEPGSKVFMVEIDRTWTTSGQKRVTIDVDMDNQVEESIEYNNNGLFIVNVL